MASSNTFHYSSDRARSRSWRDDEDDEIERLGAEISQLCEEKRSRDKDGFPTLPQSTRPILPPYVNNPAFSPISSQSEHPQDRPDMHNKHGMLRSTQRSTTAATDYMYVDKPSPLYNTIDAAAADPAPVAPTRAAYTHTNSTVPAYHAPYSTHQSQQSHVKQTQPTQKHQGDNFVGFHNYHKDWKSRQIRDGEMMGENLPPSFHPHFVKQTPYAFSEEGEETTRAIPTLNSIQARPQQQQQQQHAPQPQQRQLQSSPYQYYSYHTPSYRQDQRPRLRPWKQDDLLSDWLYHLQDVSEHLNWNINRQKMEFRSTLAEVDPSILRKLDSRLDRQTCTLEQMVELAAKHVGQDMGSMASMTDFSTCKRKNGQSAHAYMNHLEKLAARTFPGCSRREYNTRLVNQFTMGIGDAKLQDILIGLNSEATIDEAIELVH